MAEESSGALVRHSWILVGGFLAFFFLNVLNTSYSTLMALIKDELALSYTMSGALMSGYFVGYMLGQVPWGFVADKYGSRRAIVLSILGAASSTILFGLARGFWQAVLTRSLAGLLGAGVFVPGVRLISGWFPSDKRGTALGILSVGGSVGLIISSWLTPRLAEQLGWRGTIVLFGLLGLTSTTAMWLTIKDRSAEGGSGLGGAELFDVLRRRSFWVLAAVQVVRLGSNYAFIAWLPLILREEFELSLVSAGLVFSVFNIAGMISNPIGGMMSDRAGESRVLLVSFAALGLGAFLFPWVRDTTTMYIIVFALGWLVNFVRSPSFAIYPKLYGVERAGKVSGLQNTFASAGALILPLVLGYVRDASSSYRAGWIILSILLFSVAAANLFLEQPHGRQEG